ncbi:MAG: hypothetical protein QM741_13385 [Rudaea sp.]|uniref:hypothetical protein n=1 Tax=Rudaea sp. TaxID=2136325 RepID=UPI0039E52058
MERKTASNDGTPFSEPSEYAATLERTGISRQTGKVVTSNGVTQQSGYAHALACAVAGFAGSTTFRKIFRKVGFASTGKLLLPLRSPLPLERKEPFRDQAALRGVPKKIVSRFASRKQKSEISTI